MKPRGMPESREEYLNPSAVEEYERERETLYTSLTHLHTNLRMLRQLEDYRTQFFQIPRSFVYLTAVNFFQFSVVIIHRLWGDKSSDLTLPQFRERVEDWAKPKYRKVLEARVDGVEPPKDHEDILSRVENARHKRLAHLDRPFHLGMVQIATGLTIEELSSVADWLGRYFDALTVEDHRMLVVVEMQGEEPWKGELGYVLDWLATRSKWIEAYDRHEGFWCRKLLPRLASGDLADINRIRRRFNMEPVPQK